MTCVAGEEGALLGVGGCPGMMLNPNPLHDRALIGTKRKTSSSRTAILNMGQSPRVYPVRTASSASKCKESVKRGGIDVGDNVVNDNSGWENNAIMRDETFSSNDNNKSEFADPQQQCARGKKRRARKERLRAARKTDNAVNHCDSVDDHTPDGEYAKKKPREDSSVENVKKLPDRLPREFLPSQEQMLALLVKGLSFVPGSLDEKLFKKTFRRAAKKGSCCPGNVKLCGTPLSFILNSLDTVYHCGYDVQQLSSISDMFPEHNAGAETSIHFVQKIYLMDVILNRSMSPSSCPPPSAHEAVLIDPDIVAVMRCFEDDDLMDGVDFKFRTCLAFIPDAGVFYCARERRHPDSGVDNTLIPLDMSWLRLHCCHHQDGSRFHTFGDGYVKRLLVDDGQLVSIWRIGLRSKSQYIHTQKIYRACQCSDQMGPKMAPDVFSGEDAGTWPQAALAAMYNCKLASATSAREGGRHYALGCLHFNIPPTCWILDPTCDPIIDVIIDIDDEGNCTDRQSVLRIRHVQTLHRGAGRWLDTITTCNSAIHCGVQTSNARAGKSDVGSMHALGTNITKGTMKPVPYATNRSVPQDMLRDMVVALHAIGKACFPDVLGVIMGLEADSGLESVPPMDGDGVECVGYTIDMSVNLGNASHYDIHDASQGYAVWTEDNPSVGFNWYFILPNVHGVKPDGATFSGLAVRLCHGAAISWDGRVLRHCSSISMPDGPHGERVTRGARQKFQNNLYGTFTAAKEKVVSAGRDLCAKKQVLKGAAKLDVLAAGNDKDKKAGAEVPPNR